LNVRVAPNNRDTVTRAGEFGPVTVPSSPQVTWLHCSLPPPPTAVQASFSQKVLSARGGLHLLSTAIRVPCTPLGPLLQTLGGVAGASGSLGVMVLLSPIQRVGDGTHFSPSAVTSGSRKALLESGTATHGLLPSLCTESTLGTTLQLYVQPESESSVDVTEAAPKLDECPVPSLSERVCPQFCQGAWVY